MAYRIHIDIPLMSSCQEEAVVAAKAGMARHLDCDRLCLDPRGSPRGNRHPNHAQITNRGPRRDRHRSNPSATATDEGNKTVETEPAAL